MKKFRVQPDYSIIWLKGAIETGLGRDFVVVDEPLSFKLIYPVALESIGDLAVRRQASEPCSANSSLLPPRSSLEKKQSVFGLLYLPTTRNYVKPAMPDSEAKSLATQTKPQY